MNIVIEKLGRYVSKRAETDPQHVLSVLKAAYRVNGLLLKHFPKGGLLPSQRYLSVSCNEAILRALKEPGRSAVVSVFMPCEILHAYSIAPQFTEGLAGYINGTRCERAFIELAERSGVPGSYCSYHKILLGLALSGVMPKPRFILNTTLACDANTSTFRLLAKIFDVPHFTIDVPNSYSDEALVYVAAQLEETAGFIGDILGEPLDLERLREAVRCSNRSVRLHWEYYKKLGNRFLPNNMTCEMYKIFQTHVLLGTPQSERYFELLLDDVNMARQSSGGIRILWIHTIPFWQESFKNIFNLESCCQIVACDLNFDSLIEADENKPYEAMAQRLLMNTFCGPVRNRAQKAIEMARLLKADGAVIFGHWGCKQTLGGSQLMKGMFEEAGIPALTLDGDGCDRNNVNDGQMLTRLQAFLEMLEAGR